MKTYKDTNNQLHVIEPEFAHFLPVGCTPCTEEEAAVIRADNEAKRKAEYEATLTYQQKRAAEYMPYQELLDGLTKQASTDPVVKAAGDAQVAAYYAHNLEVKAKYPKV